MSPSSGSQTVAQSTSWSAPLKWPTNGSSGMVGEPASSDIRYAGRPFSKYHSSLSLGSCSLMNRMRRPGESTAFARMTCLRRGTANFVVSKNCSSAQKRTVEPVLRFPTCPTTFSSDFFFPSAKRMLYSLPSRRTHTSSRFESALTTETPTPWSPPE